MLTSGLVNVFSHCQQSIYNKSYIYMQSELNYCRQFYHGGLVSLTVSLVLNEKGHLSPEREREQNDRNSPKKK